MPAATNNKNRNDESPPVHYHRLLEILRELEHESRRITHNESRRMKVFALIDDAILLLADPLLQAFIDKRIEPLRFDEEADAKRVAERLNADFSEILEEEVAVMIRFRISRSDIEDSLEEVIDHPRLLLSSPSSTVQLIENLKRFRDAASSYFEEKSKLGKRQTKKRNKALAACIDHTTSGLILIGANLTTGELVHASHAMGALKLYRAAKELPTVLGA